ncbi:MAG TPA: hypothetical protein VK196_18460 [Magnetospirillum sp.]|nr:hypothetical protein [Magnetospirillum sp.]
MSTADDLLATARANPADARGAKRALDALAAEKRWRDEAELRQLIVDTVPGGTTHLTALARAWELAGERERAADTLVRAADAQPDNLRAVKAAFNALVGLGRNADAARFIPAMIAAAPKDVALAGQCIAIYHALGRVEDAQSLANTAVEPIWRPNIAVLGRHLPHVTQYYETGHLRAPLPFVMYGGAANISCPTFSTDAIGFRYSQAPDGTRFSPSDNTGGRGNALVTGGSTAFGIGSTSDGMTLASMLSDGETNFLNLGRPAYVLQQNTVDYLFLAGRLPPLRHIVLLAGINDVAAPRYSQVFSPHYGSFFGWNDYLKTQGRVQACFPEAYWPASIRSQFHVADTADARPEDGGVVAVMAQMLRCWKMFAESQGTRVTFVLQPVSFWINRSPPSAEARLFEEQKAVAEAGDLAIQEFIAKSYERFAIDVAQACAATGIEFIDANPLVAAHPDANGFLFVDYCHLTDDGNRVLAEILAPRLGLKPPCRSTPSAPPTPPRPAIPPRRPQRRDPQANIYPLW